MLIVDKGKLKGVFRGYKDTNTFFEFENGHTWRQRIFKIKHGFAYMPKAVVKQQNGRYYIEVEGMDEPIEVTRPTGENLLW